MKSFIQLIYANKVFFFKEYTFCMDFEEKPVVKLMGIFCIKYKFTCIQ
jgi:hypothetical protein